MDWIARQNIARYKKLLDVETDTSTIAQLNTLLREEKLKDADLPAQLKGEKPLAGSNYNAVPDYNVARDYNSVRTETFALLADAVVCTDEKGRILFFNRSAEKSFGYDASEVIGQQINMLLPDRFRAQHSSQMESFGSGIGATKRLMGHERIVWSLRKNGEEFPAEATISRDLVDGKAVMTVVHRDVTERQQLEDQRETIACELDHRTRNVLAVVNSIVALTAKHAVSIEDFSHSLQQRLVALAKTQDFLKRGPSGTTDLNELLLAELAHFRHLDQANVIIEGEPFAVTSTAVQPLALAIHELATNCAKYGALSDPNGRLVVTYKSITERDENLLLIEWIETGGPPVKPPTRKGFGTTFLEQIMKHTFDAGFAVDYRPEGIICRMTLPRAKVEASRE